MRNFKRSSAVPNVKYNYAILFWKELFWLFIYASKYFLIDHHCKPFTEFTDLLANGRIDWTSCTVHNSSQENPTLISIEQMTDRVYPISYRSDTIYSNTDNLKFHSIESFSNSNILSNIFSNWNILSIFFLIQRIFFKVICKQHFYFKSIF